MSRMRGSGFAAATTMSIWSAFATMTRSTSSVSSALRRSSVARSPDPHDARERPGLARDVADEVHAVAGDDRFAPKFARPCGRDRSLVGACPRRRARRSDPGRRRGPCPARRRECSGRCFVRGRLPVGSGGRGRRTRRTRARRPRRRRRSTTSCPQTAPRARGTAAGSCAVEAMSSTTTPVTASPMIAPVVAMRWSA